MFTNKPKLLLFITFAFILASCGAEPPPAPTPTIAPIPTQIPTEMPTDTPEPTNTPVPSGKVNVTFIDTEGKLITKNACITRIYDNEGSLTIRTEESTSGKTTFRIPQGLYIVTNSECIGLICDGPSAYQRDVLDIVINADDEINIELVLECL